jgi:hypothetical protein
MFGAKFTQSRAAARNPLGRLQIAAEASRREPSGLSVGGLFYLTGAGLVATLIIAIFFGAGFLMLTPRVGETVSGPLVQSGSEVAFSVYALLPPSSRESRRAQSSAAPPVTSESTANVQETLSHWQDTAEPKTQVAPSPSPVLRRRPKAAAAPLAPANPVLSATDITELVTRGDALLRAGAVASARPFYERAADAGDGRAALRLGATFDPGFLDRAGLGKTQADAAAARSWYRRAIDLGAADTQQAVN